MIECGLGSWVVTIRDHESGLQASVETDMWRDIPAAVEAALLKGTLPWKPFKSYRKKQAPPKDQA